MIEVEALPSQANLGTISGTITYRTSTNTEAKKITINNLAKSASELPLTGAIVTAEKEKINLPLDIESNPLFEDYLFYSPLAYSQTDKNGYYELKNLESGVYALQVNLPGFDMVSTYELRIEEGNLIHENLNFIVDGKIEASNVSTNITDFENETFSLKVFPNPVVDEFTVNLSLEQERSVVLRLYTSTGKLLISHESENIIGNYSKDFKLTTTGVYLLQVRVGSDIYVRKIVK